MDPRLNPYAPGAGAPPPELAGRSGLLDKTAIKLARLQHRRPERNLVLHGLRGVGKTVLLNRMRLEAEHAGLLPVAFEATQDRSLPSVLGPAMRTTLIKLSRGKALGQQLKQALGAFASFSKVVRLRYADVEFGFDFDPAKGVADSGDLDVDLPELFTAVGQAAAERDSAVVLFIDELQYVERQQMGALIGALHRVSQQQLPVLLIGAGLPHLLGLMGEAKSYAERLFEFVEIKTLTPPEVDQAITVPAEREGVAFTNTALQEIVQQTQGYPYFVQEWGRHAWNLAKASPITLADAKRAGAIALSELDASFFRVRLDRVPAMEKAYLLAMAQLGSGPHRSGGIAGQLGKSVAEVAPARARLMAKGLVYSPGHGETAFTVPLFDGFLLRSLGEARK